MPLVRPAASADIDALIDLSLRTIRASYTSFLGAESVEAYIGSGAVEAFVRDGVARQLVAEADGSITGYGSTEDDLLELMMVDHRLHRRGIGRVLLAALETRLFTEHEAVRLDSFEDNEVANSFYLVNGWHETGRHADPEYGIRMVAFAKQRV